jgi:uncharacterized phiE125 gp8 family phage protein
MILTEITTISGAALPVQGLKDHLRLGSGFSDTGLQDSLIEAYLRAAIAAIEGRIGKVLLVRQFLWRIENWRGLNEQPLPVAPVTGIQAVTLVDAAGVANVIAATSYALVPDTHRPKILARGVLFPTVPEDGRIEIVFDAGFGAVWSAVPADLQQAVLLLAAGYHENRHEIAPQAAGLPQVVQVLIERWRTVRVLGGGAV